MVPSRPRSTLAPVAAALLALAACAHRPASVWVDELPAPAASGAVTIGPGDTLSVRVVNQDNLTTRARVREDGRISLPFLNDVQAAGYAPAVLAQQLQTRFKDFFTAPVVTVALEERPPLKISVVGEVARPGAFTLEPGAGVLHALADAGGLTPYADREGIYVLRAGVPEGRVRFRWASLVAGEGRGATFHLQSGDVVVVE